MTTTESGFGAASIDETLTASSVAWGIPASATTTFDFDYTHGREQLLRLYDKGTRRQWIGSDRLDWSQECDPERPVGMPDEIHPLFGTEWWDKMTMAEKNAAHKHLEAWRFSQFMHGEQGALICTAKIVQTVPNIDSKYYAATQVIDEARHVEVYSRYLHEKVQLVYPLNKNLASLLDDAVSDSRWDMTYLGMQVLIEGLALAAFGVIRNMATEPLGKALNAYVMQDEARHVMFGRLALRDYYPYLTQAERDEREEFCVDACYRMRDRFLGEEVWERLGLPQEVADYVEHSEMQRTFRSYLFMRIVPILKDIGLWGPKIRKAFTDMGVIGYAETDIDAEMAGDEEAAEEFDRQHTAHVASVIAQAGRSGGAA
ncbi:ferritin-like domain-containing protein [Acidiferrimicrobium sp. IK]|uniref:ferritin-like domain-containing protein n=1 Tax=Acidiferrimicrobium sp. IK TaxID=2871700 RepID=UPI0021CB246A|nr:ferritin-like domain-containing protein [Acidiferrimicrobium sp. IK]MCU4183262.1 ferritin-like domain-containing protein [Acidiferrimicrobium sp. IK]